MECFALYWYLPASSRSIPSRRWIDGRLSYIKPPWSTPRPAILSTTAGRLRCSLGNTVGLFSFDCRLLLHNCPIVDLLWHWSQSSCFMHLEALWRYATQCYIWHSHAGLSPLFLPLAASYMTDVAALFCVCSASTCVRERCLRVAI